MRSSVSTAHSTPIGNTRANASRGYHVSVARTWPEFEALEESWNELATASNASIFQTYDWVDVWRRHFAAQFSPYIVVVWRDRQLVALAPLGIRKRKLIPGLPIAGISCLRFLADMRTPNNTILVAPGHEDAVDSLAATLLDKPGDWSFIQLHNLVQGAEQRRFLEAAEARVLPLEVKPAAEAVFIDIQSGWDALVSSRPRSVRKHLRVSQKRVSETNHRILDERNEPENVLEKILLLSRRSWKGEAGQSVAQQENGPDFVRALWQKFGPIGRMRFHLLEIEDDPVASIIWLLRPPRVYGYLTEFDERYASLSPGRFMLAHGMAELCRDGITEGDFLRKNAFTARFSDEVYRLCELTIFRRRGLSYIYKHACALYLSTLKGHGRPREQRKRWRNIHSAHGEEHDGMPR